uniref:non-specific serine/threonine protein kinase n=1 Tax=Nelumbo nucifera TaxID=4432 RepID=A0A1U8AJ90_NELNU
MFLKVVLPLLLCPFVFLLMSSAAMEDTGFIYNGFRGAKVSLDGEAQIIPNGLLMLTNQSKRQLGHAFYPYPLHFKNLPDGNVFTFSTTFVFGILPKYQNFYGHGIAFVITPSRALPGARPTQYLGIFNESNNGNQSNHVVAVELDTIKNSEFSDINDDHVGIDINGLTSVSFAQVSYAIDQSDNRKNLSLVSGKPIQVWIEYNGVEGQMNVTLAPIDVPKPHIPLLSYSRNLSPFMEDSMYVGFSSSTGSFSTSHYVLGWSFKMNGPAKELTISQLPKLPRLGPKKQSKFVTLGLPLIGLVLASTVLTIILFIVRRKRRFAEVVENWELDYGPQRFKYKDLYTATKGFRDKELLGIGGFGRVYRGVLPTSKTQVAVKRVRHESRQGLKEFVAEIVSMGRLRHRNLVQLLGYCRRERELLLVYDYMPNGSLDKFIFSQPKVTLNWSQRFRVIKGVASGLFYLHEGWEQVVVHRDVKSSNVLLDSEFNGRLGDFGLSRLYDRGTDPKTTHVVGTLGYIAPEITTTRKASPSTDVFSFGAFMLEVACGRRPIDPQASSEENVILLDRVFSCWSRGKILETVDPNLGSDYRVEEMDLVLKLGLLCSHSIPTARPTMRQVVLFLVGDIPLPESSLHGLSESGLAFAHHDEGFDKFATWQPSSSLEKTSTTQLSLVTDSLLSTGR